MSTNYVKVLRAALNGVSGRKLAQQYRVSRDTVAILLRQAKIQGWQRAEDLENITEEDLVALLSGSSGRQGKRDQSYKFPDYEYVHWEAGQPYLPKRLTCLPPCRSRDMNWPLGGLPPSSLTIMSPFIKCFTPCHSSISARSYR